MGDCQLSNEKASCYEITYTNRTRRDKRPHPIGPGRLLVAGRRLLQSPQGVLKGS